MQGQVKGAARLEVQVVDVEASGPCVISWQRHPGYLQLALPLARILPRCKALQQRANTGRRGGD